VRYGSKRMAKLTKKAQRFCYEYLIDFDPQKAAERARYAPGDAARGNAHRLLKDRRVIKEISRIKQDLLPDMSRTWLLAELHEIITDRKTAPQVKTNAIEKAAKIQHMYEKGEVVPGEVHVHLNTHIPLESNDGIAVESPSE